MVEASALYNLARQLGGSAGIAYLSTFIGHRLDPHYAELSQHVNLYDPAATARLQGLQQLFMSKGVSAPWAGQQALEVLRRMVLGQASIQSYHDAFVVMRMVFLATMPLLLLFEKSTAAKQRQRTDGHDDSHTD